MASLGHVAVGMAASRYRDRTASLKWRSAFLWASLSMLPDADVIGLPLGVDYAAPWGHRGATHSLLFAAVVGVIVGIVARWRKRSGVSTGLLAAAVLASHSLLDTLTDGGLGCALLWPFDLTRYFAPWRPIPVSPLGLAYFSPYGLVVAVTELVVFAPLIAYALVPRRTLWLLAPVWLAVLWLIGSTDPVRESLVGFVFKEDTEYASGFRDEAFRSIADGDSMERVRQSLGEPLDLWWGYDLGRVAGCSFVYFEAGQVSAAHHLDSCSRRGVTPGMSTSQVRQTLGQPPGECWHYTRSANQRPFRMRAVCFHDGRVEEIVRRWQP